MISLWMASSWKIKDIRSVLSDRINNFKKLMYAPVIDSIEMFLQVLHEQRSRLPGCVAVEETLPHARGQNLLELYPELN